ncbi:MAG TPA: hypothetical protein VGH04_13835 [Gemmatimonadaceae bacterium]|jgi:outer membrane lipoprotein SlyB
MQCNTRARVALVLFVAVAAISACGQGNNEKSAAGNVAPPSTMQPNAAPGTSYGAPAVRVETAATKPKHHSKLAGAGVGAAAGHMIGHGMAGAVAGAVIQHERNKHPK